MVLTAMGDTQARSVPARNIVNYSEEACDGCMTEPDWEDEGCESDASAAETPEFDGSQDPAGPYACDGVFQTTGEGTSRKYPRGGHIQDADSGAYKVFWSGRAGETQPITPVAQRAIRAAGYASDAPPAATAETVCQHDPETAHSLLRTQQLLIGKYSQPLP
jgi:hypothetical protein